MASASAVQFKKLNPSYKSGEDVLVGYVYDSSTGTFTPRPGDWIGVFLEGDASPEEALALVKAPDPSTHRPFESGRLKLKTGAVSVKLPDTASGKCKFWYVSVDSRVMAKSEAFTVCANTDYQSLVDEASPANNNMQTSYVDIGLQSCTMSYVDAGEVFKSDCHTSDSSFIVVSEEDSLEPPPCEYVISQGSSEDEGNIGIVAENRAPRGVREHVPEVVSSGEKVEVEFCVTEESPPQTCATTKNLVTTPPNLTTGQSKPDKSHVINKNPSASPVQSSTTKHISKSSPELSKEDTSPVQPKEPNLETKNTDNPSQSASVGLTPSHPTPSPLPPSLHTASTNNRIPGDIPDMSNSTVMAEEKHVTQREARMLKTANKDLRTKLHKLSEILSEKTAVIAQLTATVEQSEAQVRVEKRADDSEVKVLQNEIVSLKQKALKRERVEKELKEQLLSLKDQLRKSEDVRLKAESLGKKIMIEKSVLEEKIKQLTKDNRTMFDRSNTLLTQLKDSETKREILNSEKQVLEGKVDYLAKELRKIKVSQFKPIANDERSGGRGEESRHIHKPTPRYGEGLSSSRHDQHPATQLRGEKRNDREGGANLTGPSDVPVRAGGAGSRSKDPPTDVPFRAGAIGGGSRPSNNPPSRTGAVGSENRPSNNPPLRAGAVGGGSRPPSNPPLRAEAIGGGSRLSNGPPLRAGAVGGDNRPPNNPPFRAGAIGSGGSNRQSSNVPSRAVAVGGGNRPSSDLPLRAGGNGEMRGPADFPQRAGGEGGNRPRDLPLMGAHHHHLQGKKPEATAGQSNKPTAELVLPRTGERIETIAEQMRGGGAGGGGMVECPICGKALNSRENDYATLLHVEHCIELSELMT